MDTAIRSLLVKIVGGLILFVLINLAILAAMDRHFYWGSHILTEKWLDLQRNYPESNTLFIGSSKTHRAILPSLFDSLTTDEEVSGYNLGISSLGGIESFHLVENLLEQDELTLKYLFLELNGTLTSPGLFRIPRGKYYLDYRNCLLGLQTIAHSQYSASGKRTGFKHFATNYLERLTLFGLVRTYNENIMDFQEERMEQYRFHDKGAFAFEKELKITTEAERKRLLRKRRIFFKDTLMIQKKLATQPIIASFPANQPYMDHVKQLIEKAKAKGVHLVFFRMQASKRRDNHKEVETLFQHLPESNRIDLANPERFPEFYQSAYLYNAEHLNEAGARLFTKRLAQAFQNLPQPAQ